MIKDTYHHNGASKWTANVIVRAKHEAQVSRPAVWAVSDSSLMLAVSVTILLLDNRKRMG